MPEGWVRMTHPDLAGTETAVVTREAYDDVWYDKGYRLANRAGEVVDDPEEAEPDSVPATERQELEARASALGVEHNPSMRDDTLRRRIAEAETKQGGDG